jgi:type II secretory pathway pseudopilin PulG
MNLNKKFRSCAGFTLAEIGMAMGVAAVFGMAVFASNARLLVALKSQRESTAASMMLQEQMEAFRYLGYTGLATNTTTGTSPPTTAADVVATTTVSEAQLGGGLSNTLTETITVSGYMDTSGNVPPTVAAQNQWVRDSSHTTGNLVSSSATLATAYDLLKVDIQLSWKGANGRTRNRELTSVFGKGNGR